MSEEPKYFLRRQNQQTLPTREEEDPEEYEENESTTFESTTTPLQRRKDTQSILDTPTSPTPTDSTYEPHTPSPTSTDPPDQNGTLIEAMMKRMENLIEKGNQQMKTDLIEEMGTRMKTDREETRTQMKTDREETRTQMKTDREEMRTQMRTDREETRKQTKDLLEKMETRMKGAEVRITQAISNDIKELRNTLDKHITNITLQSEIPEEKTKDHPLTDKYEEEETDDTREAQIELTDYNETDYTTERIEGDKTTTDTETITPLLNRPYQIYNTPTPKTSKLHRRKLTKAHFRQRHYRRKRRQYPPKTRHTRNMKYKDTDAMETQTRTNRDQGPHYKEDIRPKDETTPYDPKSPEHLREVKTRSTQLRGIRTPETQDLPPSTTHTHQPIPK